MLNIFEKPATRLHFDRYLQSFLSEGHISYHTKIRGQDILRNEIVAGYVNFYKSVNFS